MAADLHSYDGRVVVEVTIKNWWEMNFRGALQPGECRIETRTMVTGECRWFYDSFRRVEHFVSPELVRQGFTSYRLLWWEIRALNFTRDTYVLIAGWAVRNREATWNVVGHDSGPAFEPRPESERLLTELTAERAELAARIARALDVPFETVAELHQAMVAEAWGGEDTPESSDPRPEGSVRFEAPCPDCGAPCEWVAYVHPPVPGWCKCQGERPE